MFVTQAAEQFEAWTGLPAPKRLFQRVCHETLETPSSGELKDR
jgi:shikimate 5-dehydrogenase